MFHDLFHKRAVDLESLLPFSQANEDTANAITRLTIARCFFITEYLLELLDWPAAVATQESRVGHDGFNNVVRRVDSHGNITTLAGFWILQDPVALTTDDSGNVYTADLTCLVWKITPDGSMSIVAGNGQCGPGQDRVPATVSALQFPSGLAVDSRGNFYVAHTSNNRIRVVNTAGIINTVAGNGTCGFGGDEGPAKCHALRAEWSRRRLEPQRLHWRHA